MLHGIAGISHGHCECIIAVDVVFVKVLLTDENIC
jgi:hypothetical protein